MGEMNNTKILCDQEADEDFQDYKPMLASDLYTAEPQILIEEETDDVAVVDPSNVNIEQSVVEDHGLENAEITQNTPEIEEFEPIDITGDTGAIYNQFSIIEKEREEKNILPNRDDNRYFCDECDYSATKLVYIKSHKASRHDGIRFECDLCDFSATTKAHLSHHKASIHVGVKYPCDQCEYAATKGSDLRRHKKSRHEGPKYFCDRNWDICF